MVEEELLENNERVMSLKFQKNPGIPAEPNPSTRQLNNSVITETRRSDRASKPSRGSGLLARVVI